MNFKVLILACLFAYPVTSDADEIISSEPLTTIKTQPESISTKPEKRRVRRQRGKNQIRDLKKGTLLIRLKTDEKRIAAFEKKGDVAKAEIIRRYRRENNLRIVKSFKKNYTYSKMLFFFSSDSEKVKNGQFDGIFLNDSLEVDPSLKLDTETWFIGEFDVLEADTAKYRESTYWNPVTKKLEYTYWGTSADFSRRALIIRDKNFIQLRRPFPYYISCRNEDTADPLVKAANQAIKRTIDEAIIKMHKKLNRKYNRFFVVR